MLYVALGAQAALVACAYWWETCIPASSAGSSLRRALVWSGVWFLLGLVPTVLFGVFDDSTQASSYAAVYLIERALSLDNVFVFAVLIAAFQIPARDHDRLVSQGVLFAFVLRVPAIFAGVALFDASHFVAYALGVLLILLAWQTARPQGRKAPGPNRIVRALQRHLPVSDHAGARWVVVRDSRRYVTPMFLCLIAIGLADIAFALDSIPAALAISHDQLLLLSANLFALLGLRPLYQLVAVARARLRYMDQTIAVLLLFVAIKLLSNQIIHIGPVASLIAVIILLSIGSVISLHANPRQPT